MNEFRAYISKSETGAKRLSNDSILAGPGETCGWERRWWENGNKRQRE